MTDSFQGLVPSACVFRALTVAVLLLTGALSPACREDARRSAPTISTPDARPPMSRTRPSPPPAPRRARADPPAPRRAYADPPGIPKVGDRVSPGLSLRVVQRVIRRHLKAIKGCYMQEALSAMPALHGMVLLKIIISPKGRVSQAKIERRTLWKPAFGRCVLRQVRTWRFPKPSTGKNVVVRYPLHFRPPGAE